MQTINMLLLKNLQKKVQICVNYPQVDKKKYRKAEEKNKNISIRLHKYMFCIVTTFQVIVARHI